MQGYTIGKHHRARRGKHIGTTQTKRAVGVANVAFADDNAGFVFDQVFGGGRVNADHILLRQHTGGIGITGVTGIARIAPHPHLLHLDSLVSLGLFKHLFMGLHRTCQGHAHRNH